MSHKYTLIEILLISKMKSACYMTHTLTIPDGVGGGGSGVIPATLDPSMWSIQQGLSRLIFKILILPISHIEDAMLKLHLYFQLLRARKKASVIIDTRMTINYRHLADWSRIFLWHICNFVYLYYALWPLLKYKYFIGTRALAKTSHSAQHIWVLYYTDLDLWDMNSHHALCSW